MTWLFCLVMSHVTSCHSVNFLEFPVLLCRGITIRFKVFKLALNMLNW